MRVNQIKEFGHCDECEITQPKNKNINFYEIAFGVHNLRTVHLCEKCIKKLQSLQQEEK